MKWWRNRPHLHVHLLEEATSGPGFFNSFKDANFLSILTILPLLSRADSVETSDGSIIQTDGNVRWRLTIRHCGKNQNPYTRIASIKSERNLNSLRWQPYFAVYWKTDDNLLTIRGSDENVIFQKLNISGMRTYGSQFQTQKNSLAMLMKWKHAIDLTYRSIWSFTDSFGLGFTADIVTKINARLRLLPILLNSTKEMLLWMKLME